MLRLCRVHWNGDSLEVHGTNPQWEHLAIDDTWDADPAGLPVVNVAESLTTRMVSKSLLLYAVCVRTPVSG